MENRKLHKENGLFKALQYISGKAERWSLSNPVVFLFGVLDYAGLHGEHPSQRLVLFKGWCKGLEKSLIQLTLTGACNVNQKICPYWRSEMNWTQTLSWRIEIIITEICGVVTKCFTHTHAQARVHTHKHTRVYIRLMFTTTLKRWCMYWVLLSTQWIFSDLNNVTPFRVYFLFLDNCRFICTCKK